MSFFLVYDLLVVELLGLVLSVGYICFHFGYRFLSTYQDVRTSVARRVAQRKKIQKKLAHAQKTKSSSSPAPVQAPSRLSKKKKLTAAENKGLEAALKRVHAKNAVKEFEEARAAIIQGLTIDKHNIELNVLLAGYYERLSDFSKAEIIYKDLIVYYEPEDASLYVYLGDNLMNQSKPKLAYEVYKQAQAREGDNIDVLFALADLAYETLDYESSMKYASTIVEKQGKNIPALEILAQAHMQLEQYQKAYDVFLRIRKLDPYNATVQKWIERLEEKLGIHPDVKRLSDS